MACDAGGPFRHPAARLGLAVATCGLLAACGDSSGPPRGAPTAAITPTPGTSPTPAAVSFLHVRHEGGDVTTYQIDATTGRLQPAGTQRLGDVRALVGDPDGRYVYVAFDPRTLPVDPPGDASIALYEADKSGTLVALSEAPSRPWEMGHGYSCGNFGWSWLAASRDRVWGMWLSRYGGGCQHEVYTAITHAVAAGGQLGPVARGDSWIDSGWAAIDPAADMLYKSRYGFLYYGPAPLTAHAVGADGQLAGTGYSDLCVASELGDPVKPLVAVRGFVFGSAYLGRGETVCSWEGPRLAPRANLGFAASHGAAFTPADGTTAALLAMAGDVYAPHQHVYARTDLRLLSMESGGNAALLDTVELPSRVLQLLFHPAGRFLYVADEDGRLRTYSVSAGQRLDPIERLPDAARPSVGGTWPYYEAEPPFLAVSVHSDVPRP
jgi:hypothetical protein